jgi:hypothetical protein
LSQVKILDMPDLVLDKIATLAGVTTDALMTPIVPEDELTHSISIRLRKHQKIKFLLGNGETLRPTMQILAGSISC